MHFSDGSEIGYIYEDEECENPEERYKLLMAEPDFEALCVKDTLYTSANLIDWSLKENVFWGDGTEPLTSVFYNKHKKVHTIIQRCFWGIRSVGYKETEDFKTFTEYNECLYCHP